MHFIDIGKSGVKGSAIAPGCMRIKDLEEKELNTYLHTALDCGINFFDHADIYGGGLCETKFGKALRDNPGLRDKMIIQSKCGIRKGMFDFSKEHILNSVDGILNRLQTDHLDILLLHRPDALMEPDEIAEAFDALERSGKVLHFGVSNFNSRQLAFLQATVSQKLIVNQLQFSIMHTGMIDHSILTNTAFAGSVDRDGEILDYCRLHDITIQAWSPFQYGFFEGIFIDNDKFPELNLCMERLSEKYGVSKNALAAAWILRHPAKMQVIAGTTNPERLRDICKGADITLSREDWYAVYLAAGNKLP